jgi:mRNA-degrading endonuclease RelE of RelBE toxin-antitoxin system
MISYDFTRVSEREFLKLPKDIQRRIIKKVEFYLSAPDPLAFAKRLTGDPLASYRFQIGDYRAAFDWEGKSILITRVGHRKEIYR